MAKARRTHSPTMMQALRVWLTASATVLVVACMSKTTSLGSAGDEPPTGDASPSVDGGCSVGGPRDACPKDQYCRSNNGTCAGPGQCVVIPPPPPPSCPFLECTCDGKMGCPSTGVNIAPPGFCSVPCGPKTCDGLLEYCAHGSGVTTLPDGGGSTGFECVPVPSACAVNRTCSCLNASRSGNCTVTDGRFDLVVDLP